MQSQTSARLLLSMLALRCGKCLTHLGSESFLRLYLKITPRCSSRASATKLDPVQHFLPAKLAHLKETEDRAVVDGRSLPATCSPVSPAFESRIFPLSLCMSQSPSPSSYATIIHNRRASNTAIHMLYSGQAPGADVSGESYLSSRPSLSALKVVELRQLLRERGLPVSGRKDALVERLLAWNGTPLPSTPATSESGYRPTVSIERDLETDVLKNGRRTTAKPHVSVKGAGRSGNARERASQDRAVPMTVTPRTVPRRPERCLRVVTWNVAGLRGALGRAEALATLRELTSTHGEAADVLMLQETKLQPQHVAEWAPKLLALLPGGEGQWDAHFACSTARKGYSGVCTVWRRAFGDARLRALSCEPLQVDAAHEAGREGRTLVLRLALDDDADSGAARMHLINVYTPNSGVSLERLGYRSGEGGWDERFRSALLALEGPRDFVCVGGDLNVAVADEDFHNPSEPRTAKQAGTTPEERDSMRAMLAPPLALQDAFRIVHPDARGQFTYWSQRARSRPPNRGLRIDYFLLSPQFLRGAIVDCQHLQQLHGSDHCPVVLTLDLDSAFTEAF